ncbi:RNase A-like domain-containing protein [Pseudomonas citronellolis]|uniref:two-partner secretion domain-containing protein n=1 Tax=Pseudomonas citronellolis TaxID=53408 RepID=UPI00071856C2|nr:RNase A-like domain-containing protein [Pseudomonas citronellolis]KRV73914.1 hypothetical protein AO742_16720 [Pseudomonas citronellolis]KRW78645.1 hypothetical protein AO738_05695 [Pseudomonas citronellolis]
MDIRRPFYQAIASALAGLLFLNPIVATAAQLAVDAAAGGNTQIGAAGNGVPIVNIATPNGSGLSHNKFSDYNVGQQGLILNNATGKTASTQLGGIVIGNPNLKGQAAQKILNEVTGANPSQLKGYTEVAGQGAHVIVANPHGITCNGCGFINTPRATLTTGKPILAGERLQGYDVDGGEIAIEGAGLNASNLDQFELITRSAKLNADLYAKQLTVVAGRNTVDAQTLAATAKPDDGSAKPQLAIDSAALGGMYANTIRLVGTEQGVGVKLAGNMAASAGDIRIDANGKLELAQVAASGDLALKGQDVALNGPAYAGGSASVQASGALSNAQSLAAGSAIELKASQLSNSGVIEAGVNADNSRNARGDVAIDAQNLRNAGTVLASRNLQAKVAGTLDNQGGAIKGGNANLTANTLDNRQGRLLADGNLTLAAQHLDNRNGQTGAASLQVSGGDLDNRLGLFSAGQALSLDLTSLDNSGQGTLVSNGTLQAKVSQKLDNHADGLLSAKGALGVQAGAVDNRGGRLVSDAILSVSGGKLDNSTQGVASGKAGLQLDLESLDNSDGGTLASSGDLRANVRGALDNHGDGALVASGRLAVMAGSLDNQGGLLSSNGNLQLASGASDNRGGQILAQGRLDASTADLDNRDGVLSGQQGLSLHAGDIRNGTRAAGQPGGLITSQGALDLRAGQFEAIGGGEVSAKGDLQLTVTRLIQQQAKLIGEGNVRIDLDSNGQHGDFDNRGGLLSAEGALQVNGLGNLDNRGGEISSNQSFVLNASGDVDNGDQGGIISAGQLSLSAAALRNVNQGLLSGWQALAVNAASLDNSASGTLSSRNGTLDVTLSGVLDNHDQGALVSQGKLTLAAGSLNNAGGILSTQSDLGLALSGDLDNRNGGLLSAQGELAGSGRALDNRGGEINANGMQLDASSLDNSGGSLASSGALHLGLLGALLNLGPNAKLASAGPLDLSAGSVDNRGGQLVSQGLLKVLAGRFDNSAGGTVASQNALNLSLSGDLLNGQDGLIYSKAGKLDIGAASLDNSGGTLQGQLDTTLRIQGAAGNQGGRITSQAGNLDLRSASLDNGSGGVLDSAAGWLKLVTGGFSNNAGITQAQSLDVQATGGIDNRNGHLSAVSGNNTLVTSDLDNRGGGLYAGELLSVTGNQLLNQGAALGQGGKIGAGDIDFSLAGALNNRFGLVESSGSLDLSAASIDNVVGAIRALGQDGSTRVSSAGLLDNNLGRIETAAQDFSLQAGALQNGGGSVLHVGTGSFGIDLAQAGLAGGSFTTNGSLSYQAANWTNNSIIQARNLTLSVGTLNQDSGGQLLAAQSFNGSGGNWTNNGLIASDGSLDLSLSGSYTGNGRLSSLGDLTLGAGYIGLGASASIAGGGSTRVSSSGTLDNSGRLTSAAGLQVSAANLNNYGTLGSAANLRLVASNLLNQNGLIFSGGDMALRVGSFTNREADVYSLGALDLAADDAGNRAARLDNLSANLESVGDMRLNVAALNNQRVVLVVNDAGKYTAKIVEVDCYKYFNNSNADCDGGKEHQVWEITERDKLEVLQASAASSISAGGNLSISGDTLTNASSVISAGQNLYANVGSLSNQGVVTGETETMRVFRSERTRDPESRRDEADAFTDRYWVESPDYVDDPQSLTNALSHFIARTEREYPEYGSVTQLNSGDQTYAGIIQAAGNVSISASNPVNNSVIRNNYTYVNPGQKTGDTAVGASPVSTVVPINAQLPPDLAQQQVNPITLPGFSLPQGQNGLFRLSGEAGSGGAAGSVQGAGDPALAGASSAQSDSGLNIPRVQGLPSSTTPSNSHKYLIETNPELTSLKSFLSSDYLLGLLGYDPDQAQKRLGDGLYEQRLIQQAVVARTGQRFIDGMASDEALFKYLMDNAIAYKDSLNLTVGVGLTAEQVAALTHDIVWLEEAVVNGEKVLVPVLYLAQADNRLAPNGALIQGQDVSLISGGELNNAGTLRASNNLNATAANITNSGLAEAGNRLDLLATDSIRNTAGGIIAGRDVSLTALTGDVINERSVTRIDSAQGNRTWTTSFADSAARIEAAGNLDISAGRDIGNLGGALKAGNDLLLNAGRDVNISAVQVENGQVNGSRSYSQSVQQLGAEVSAGRDLDISAGRDLTAVASSLDAARNAALSAGRDVTLASAADESHSYSKTKKVTAQEDHVHQQSTTLNAGGDVLVSAGENITLKSSKIGAGNEAYLVAGDKIELLAENDSDYSLYEKKKKGSFGSKSFKRDEVTDVKAVGSQISAGADITLLSGGDQKYQAAKLESGNDIAIVSGGAVTFEAVKDLHQESHEKSKSNLAWQSAKGKGKTDEAVRQSELIANGSITIKAIDGLNIDYKHIDQKTVSQAIDAMVQADPNLAWLKDAEARGDVDWRAVKELHDSYSYSSSGLGAGAQLAIAIIVTYLTAGAASAAIGSAAGATAGSGTAMAAGTAATAATTASSAGWANLALTAVATSAASQAAISTINNRGNLGAVVEDVTSRDALKGYVAAGISAGYSPDNMALQLSVKAALKTATQGGSFTKNLGQAAIDMVADTVSGAIYNKVGNALVGTGLSTKVAVHAIVGGLIAEAAGGDFRSGALAAGANEALVASFGDKIFPGQQHEQLLAMTSQLVGMTVAAGVGGDEKAQEKAGWVAQQATLNNYLAHEEVDEMAKELIGCRANANPDACRGQVKDKFQEANDSKTGAKLYGCQSLNGTSCAAQLDAIEAGSKALDRLVDSPALLPEEKAIVEHFQEQTFADYAAGVHLDLITFAQENYGAILVGGGVGAAVKGAGEATVPKEAAKAVSPIVPGGGLAAHEAAGGHLIAKHVGQSEAQLLSRLSAEPKITGSSSFYDRTFAEKAVSQTLDMKQAEIASWLSGSANRLRLDHTLSSPVGISVARGASSAVDASSVRVILVRDSKMPTGYKILTGFPTVP